jgi:hypothetical protein
MFKKINPREKDLEDVKMLESIKKPGGYNDRQ